MADNWMKERGNSENLHKARIYLSKDIEILKDIFGL